MKRPVGLAAYKIQVIAIIALFLQSCGIQGTPSPSKSCATNQAIVNVHDTYLERVCGCAEGRGTFIGNTLQCTVSLGTVVFFYYPDITFMHTILGSSGVNPWSFSPKDPTQANPATFVDSALLNVTGNHTFADQQTGNGGTFIVQ